MFFLLFSGSYDYHDCYYYREVGAELKTPTVSPSQFDLQVLGLAMHFPPKIEARVVSGGFGMIE